MPVGQFQPDLARVLREHRARLRALEAVPPGSAFVCPTWDELTPSLILAGAGVATQPSTPDADQFDLTCNTGEGPPGDFWTTGELIVAIGTDPGSGTASTHYVIGWNAAIGTGAASQIVGYGRTYKPGGTISYPSLLTSGGRVQIQGVNDGGGGATPTFARPDFPFVFAAGDVVFEGHYLCWGSPSL